jgi:subtilisin family serine protease
MLTAWALIFLSVFSFNLTSAQEKTFAPGEAILKLKSPVAPSFQHNYKLGVASLDALNQTLGVTKIASLFQPAPTVKFRKKADELNRFIKITVPAVRNLSAILSMYDRDPNVEYAQPNYRHQIDFVPNDSLFSQQTALQVIQAEAAWNIQLASPAIIVGVIDTGIDYHHEDLRNALWINSGEDLNGNGQIDASDFNGIDDDGNGFVDDLRGWDFTDAPSFPDGGDFQIPDNDPLDEHGHGTSVAGLIGATGNNREGIAGLAFGCRVMNLRAGTSLGFLEEDDVASAIVYAVENGARVINMSFGDEVASPLLRDVMRFAYNQNCVLVASAGNSATDKIHYPSGLDETISVGATDDADRLAGFSNYGSSVDVVAPGVSVLTTQRGNSYGPFSGTSASAPLVSALAALVLSKIPDLPNESVKSLITSATDDLGAPGWDNLFAAGRINAARALGSPGFATARIFHPQVDQAFSVAPIGIRATAAGAFLEEYVLQIGLGETPAQWQELIRQKNRQVIDEPIFVLNFDNLADSQYTLRLIAQNKDGTAVEDKVRFFIDRTPPVISNVRATPMIDGDRHSVLVEFETDDLCDAAVHFRGLGSSEVSQILPSRFRTTSHRVNISQSIFTGKMEYFIEARNGAGLSAIIDNNGNLFTVDLSAPPVGGAPIEKLNVTLPAGLLLSKPADFDGDGEKEIILNQYDEALNFTFLKILEFNQTRFDEVFSSSRILIPRDWGDADGDGLLEILAGVGSKSFILEAPAPGTFPSRIVWSDSGEVWADRFADLDQDNRGEIILRLDDLYTLWETTGDNEYARVDSFPNPTSGGNFVGVPHAEIGDFDGDGQQEILLGDFDGDIYIYENRGDNRYEFSWSDLLPLVDTIDYLTVGDYDGDGVAEFVVGCHSDPTLNLESEFDSRHWLYRVYKSNGDNSFAPVWEQAFFGFLSPAQFDAGVASGDIDNDGRPEILINVFPDFYIVDFDPNFSEYRVVWHAAPNRSNSAVVGDFDRNGFNEFFFNAGEQVVSYQFLSDYSGPPAPLGFKARPLDVNLIELSWQVIAPATGFQVYRGTDPDNLPPLIFTKAHFHIDSTVTADTDYWYRITTIDSSRSPVESLPTPLVNVRPGAKPFLERAAFIFPDQLQLVFNEPMDNSIKNQNNYEIENIGTPTSAIVHRSGKEVMLSFASLLTPGSYRVTVRSVGDLDGTPIDTLRNSAAFDVTEQAKAPYLVKAELAGENQLRLEFNEAMDAASVANIENYIIEPDIKVSAASLSGEDSKLVILQIAVSSPIGPFGINYLITVRNVKSARGFAIQFGQGDSAALIFSSPTLEQVFAYPNPYRSSSGRNCVIIAGLTREATVRILDASGRLLRTLKETDGNGGIEWDVKDDSGNLVPSGIYIFYVVNNKQKKFGKLAVIR